MPISNKILGKLPLVYVFLVHSAFAQTCPPGQICNPIQLGSFEAVIGAIASLLARVAIPLVSIFFIYAGFLFVTARGNDAKLKSAKDVLYYSVIGALIIVGAKIFAEALINFARDL